MHFSLRHVERDAKCACCGVAVKKGTFVMSFAGRADRGVMHVACFGDRIDG